MNRTSLLILGLPLLACFARTPVQAQAADSIQLTAGSTVPVILEKSVDARKNKVGDKVVAKTTEHVKSNGQVVIPKNSKILGHVTATKARTKDAPESAVGIAFDHALLKNGREVLLVLEIQAVAPPQLGTPPTMSMSPATAGGSGDGAPPMPGGGSMGPLSDPNAGTPGRIASPANSASVAADTLTSAGGLTPSCHGVLGIDGLGLEPQSADAAQGSLIVSLRRNVHLDGGTQMMLRVIGK